MEVQKAYYEISGDRRVELFLNDEVLDQWWDWNLDHTPGFKVIDVFRVNIADSARALVIDKFNS